MTSLRAKIKRRLSIKDTPGRLSPPSPPNLSIPLLTLIPQTADFSADEADEETTAHMAKEIEEAEKHGYDAGKPGSFINKLIERGNRKTEEQIRKEGMVQGGK
jgi:hypothetical protein